MLNAKATHSDECKLKVIKAGVSIVFTSRPPRVQASGETLARNSGLYRTVLWPHQSSSPGKPCGIERGIKKTNESIKTPPIKCLTLTSGREEAAEAGWVTHDLSY